MNTRENDGQNPEQANQSTGYFSSIYNTVTGWFSAGVNTVKQTASKWAGKAKEKAIQAAIPVLDAFGMTDLVIEKFVENGAKAARTEAQSTIKKTMTDLGNVFVSTYNEFLAWLSSRWNDATSKASGEKTFEEATSLNSENQNQNSAPAQSTDEKGFFANLIEKLTKRNIVAHVGRFLWGVVADVIAGVYGLLKSIFNFQRVEGKNGGAPNSSQSTTANLGEALGGVGNGQSPTPVEEQHTAAPSETIGQSPASQPEPTPVSGPGLR